MICYVLFTHTTYIMLAHRDSVTYDMLGVAMHFHYLGTHLHSSQVGWFLFSTPPLFCFPHSHEVDNSLHVIGGAHTIACQFVCVCRPMVWNCSLLACFLCASTSKIPHVPTGMSHALRLSRQARPSSHPTHPTHTRTFAAHLR